MATADERPVGFLDSGIGGVTVLRRAKLLLPNENCCFFSDSKYNPYGDRTDAQIISRCTEIVNFLINEKNCKAIVIACNTASAKAARTLRSRFKNTPIIAIEPAYKMVHDKSPNGATLIMATKGTISSEKFRRLYYSYYNHKTSIHSCVGLADIIENGTKEQVEEYLKINLSRYKGKVENVVLGCTHYPLIKEEITKTLGNVKFFDGADGVSRRLQFLLSQNGIENDKNAVGRIEFFDSSDDEETRILKEKRFFRLLNESGDEEKICLTN